MTQVLGWLCRWRLCPLSRRPRACPVAGMPSGVGMCVSECCLALLCSVSPSPSRACELRVCVKSRPPLPLRVYTTKCTCLLPLTGEGAGPALQPEPARPLSQHLSLCSLLCLWGVTVSSRGRGHTWSSVPVLERHPPGLPYGVLARASRSLFQARFHVLTS